MVSRSRSPLATRSKPGRIELGQLAQAFVERTGIAIVDALWR